MFLGSTCIMTVFCVVFVLCAAFGVTNDDDDDDDDNQQKNKNATKSHDRSVNGEIER